MSDVYSDDYASVAGADRAGLIPASLSRLAGAALFLVLVGAMAFWAYRLGTRDAAEVPVIRAMEGPARIQPEDPGGLQADHQGLEVNAVLAGDPAPAPEVAAPMSPPPSVLAEEDGPQGELVMSPPPAIAEAEPADGQDLRMPLQDEPFTAEGMADPDAAVDAETAAVLAAVLGEAVAPDTEGPDAAELDATPDQTATVRPLRRPSNLVVARAPAPVATAAPAPSQTMAATRPAAASTPVPTATAPAPAATVREVRAVSPGSRLIQLGAYDNEALTRQAWERLVGRNGDLLGSKSLFVERTTANARVFYRLRVAGFDNAEQTRVMCEQLRARGVDCIPVTLQ
jgi:hypothetical protein